MYFSKIHLQFDLATAYKRYQLENKGFYSTHQLLWRLFEGDESRGFLFRQEETNNGSFFYCLSKSEPLSHADDILRVQTKLFQPKISKGQLLHFNLRANPTVYLTGKDNKGRRHDVLMHAKYLAKKEGVPLAEISNLMEQAAINWINDEQRLHRWGIQLPHTPIVGAYRQHQSVKRNNKSPICFSSVDYEGILKVQEPEVFLEQYTRGFGASKSFGCGLMLLKAR